MSVDPADGEKGQLAFATSLSLDFPLIPDTDRNLCLLYRAAQTPRDVAIRQSVLIDKDGVVRLLVQDPNLNVRTHGADILTAMRQLGLAQ